MCGLPPGSRHILTLSECFPHKFTCSDGSCVDLGAKCDSVLDCADGSDEEECSFVVAEDGYDKEQIPSISQEETEEERLSPVQVYISVGISSIPDIDASRGRFRSDFRLRLRWHDPRLRFRDLDETPELNDLRETDRAILWSPRLEVVNAIGPAADRELLRGDSTIRLIRKEKSRLPEDYSLPREGK